MADDSPPDPMIGMELIRVSLERHAVHLDLGKFGAAQLDVGSLHLWAVFHVREGGECSSIATEERVGNLKVLWDLVGLNVTDVIWDEPFRIVLDGRIEIEVPEVKGGYRGQFLGGIGERHIWEEF